MRCIFFLCGFSIVLRLEGDGESKSKTKRKNYTQNHARESPTSRIFDVLSAIHYAGKWFVIRKKDGSNMAEKIPPGRTLMKIDTPRKIEKLAYRGGGFIAKTVTPGAK